MHVKKNSSVIRFKLIDWIQPLKKDSLSSVNLNEPKTISGYFPKKIVQLFSFLEFPKHFTFLDNLFIVQGFLSLHSLTSAQIFGIHFPLCELNCSTICHIFAQDICTDFQQMFAILSQFTWRSLLADFWWEVSHVVVAAAIFTGWVWTPGLPGVRDRKTGRTTWPVWRATPPVNTVIYFCPKIIRIICFTVWDLKYLIFRWGSLNFSIFLHFG